MNLEGLERAEAPHTAEVAVARPAMVLRSIRVDRMPGTPRGKGFAIVGFSPGITVVHGPNGSGKSTTARAIERLLWPAAGGPAEARGRTSPGSAHGGPATVQIGGEWLVDGVPWTVELDGRHVEWRCGDAKQRRFGASIVRTDERAASAPETGPAELRHRYRLDLIDLLLATDQDDRLALAVQRDLSGGFDLAAIREALGVGTRPAGRGAELRALRDALDALRGAQARAESLEQARSERLPELQRRLDLARERASMADAVRQALRRLEAESSKQQAEANLAGLPAIQLQRCRPDDEASLESLSTRLDHAQRALASAREVLEREAQRLGGRAIGPTHLDEAASLERLADTLDELRRSHRDQEVALAAAREARDQSLRLLAPQGHRPAAPEAVAEAVAGMREDLDATHLAREGHQLQARREAIEALRRQLLQRGAAERLAAAGPRLRQVRRDLAEWLSVGGPDSAPTATLRSKWDVIAALALAGVLAFFLVVFHSPWWALAWVVAAGIALVSTRLPFNAQRERRRTVQARVERATSGSGSSDGEDLVVAGPEAWTTEAVADRLARLEEASANAALAERAMAEHLALDESTRALSDREARHREAMRALEARFGRALPEDEAWLPVLAGALADWQRAQRQVAQARTALETLDRQARDLLRAVTAKVAPLALGEVPALPDEGLGHPSAAFIGQEMRRIARELGALVESAARAEDASRRIRDHLEPAAAHARSDLARFFQDRGLTPGDLSGLRGLLGRLAEHREAESALAKAVGALEQIPPPPPDLPASPDDLRSLLAESEQAADERERLSAEIGAIRQDLERTGSGREVAEALAAVAAARERLQRLREEEQRIVAAEVLLEHVEQQSVARTQPEVLLRARTLLTRFTHGRFDLRLGTSNGSPAFRVFDSAVSMEKPLAALSAGERIQLLCAVRLAFIEHEERRALPLIVDEALGTCDEQRAEALMDSLIDVARQGRQVICFTAQCDEVARWASRIERAGDVPWTLVDLGRIRLGEAARLAPLPSPPPPPLLPPPPDGLDYAAYGALLQVPGLDPLTQQAEEAHLWHALDDAAALHRLLAVGFGSIGQVQQFRKATGQAPPGCDEATCRRIAAAARGLTRLFERWRVGRCRPIDFDELRETGVVSETFAERLRGLLAEVEGDPMRLLAALESERRPAKWQRARTVELRERLAAQGLLASGAAIGDEDLELDLRIHLDDALRSGDIDPWWPRRAVGSIAGQRQRSGTASGDPGRGTGAAPSAAD